jgi:hypothetical protein
MTIFHDAKTMLSGKYGSGITDGLLLGKAIGLLYIQNRSSIRKGKTDNNDKPSGKNNFFEEGRRTPRAWLSSFYQH